MTFRSPSRRAAIEIWQTGVENSLGARVQLVTAQRRIELYRVRSDALIYFVHVYWSPDETKVGVLATGAVIFHLACNVKTGASIPFEEISAGLRKSIGATYHVPPEEDPIRWAALVDAQIEFFKLHPEIRVSYH